MRVDFLPLFVAAQVVVWSAGLFDYFDDRRFVVLLAKPMSSTASGGWTVVGNFSTENPTEAYQEICGDWKLIHRSASALLSLAQAAGAPWNRVQVDSERERINLFLRILK